MTLAFLASFFSTRRFPLTTERALQDAIADEFARAAIPFRREHRLSARDRVDFMVGSIALEVKIGGQRRAIHSQLVRYGEHDEVQAIALATNLVLGLPDLGKPVRIIELGKSWL